MNNVASALSGALGNLPLSTVLTAAVTLLICLVAVHILGKLLRRLLSRTRLDERIQRYALAALKLLLYVVTVVIVAESLNIPMTSLVALLSVGSLGITLAAEDILGNVAGGLVILSSRPFSIGDFVEVSGTSGTVYEITLNHTKLVTTDGHMAMCPTRSCLLQDDQLQVLGAAGSPEGHRLLRRPHGYREVRLHGRRGHDGERAGGPGPHGVPDRLQGELHRVHGLLLGHAGELLAGLYLPG